MTDQFKSGDRVFHRRRKQAGTFIYYDDMRTKLNDTAWVEIDGEDCHVSVDQLESLEGEKTTIKFEVQVGLYVRGAMRELIKKERRAYIDLKIQHREVRHPGYSIFKFVLTGKHEYCEDWKNRVQRIIKNSGAQNIPEAERGEEL